MDENTDIAVFRPSTGVWYIERSSSQQVVGISFGRGSDKAVPADYTGDLKADIAIFRPETGYWYIVRSENNTYYGFPLGQERDTPAPADYDGDGRTDPAVFRDDGTWHILKSSVGYEMKPFGMKGDEPAEGAYVRAQ